MRFDAKERDVAMVVMAELARKLDPDEPAALIDAVAGMTGFDKTTVLAAWLRLLKDEKLAWRHFKGTYADGAACDEHDLEPDWWSAKERAFGWMLCRSRVEGPMKPHVLIDAVAQQLRVDKNAVIAAWLMALNGRLLDWRHDGKVVISDRTAPAEEPHCVAVQAMRQHFHSDPRAIGQHELADLLTDQTGLPAGLFFGAIDRLIDELGELAWAANFRVIPTEWLRRPLTSICG